MKNLFIFALFAAIALSLTACGVSQEEYDSLQSELDSVRNELRDAQNSTTPAVTASDTADERFRGRWTMSFYDAEESVAARQIDFRSGGKLFMFDDEENKWIDSGSFMVSDTRLALTFVTFSANEEGEELTQEETQVYFYEFFGNMLYLFDELHGDLDGDDVIKLERTR
jgi:hypothetical protein